LEPDAAEGEGFRGEVAETCGQLGEAWLAVFGNQDLPVRPAAVFENAAGEPRGVRDGIDLIAVHVLEEVAGKSLHRRGG